MALHATHKMAAHGKGAENVSQNGYAHGRDAPHTMHTGAHARGF